jgi:hypothetical protein
MPETDKFTAIGAFNGFPASSCIERIDVTDFDRWTTFSGFKKEATEDVTNLQISESLRLAGKMYWNLYKLKTDTINPDVTAEIPDVEITGQHWDIFNGDPQPDAVEPLDRVCTLSNTYITDDVVLSSVASSLASNIVRMYLGDIDDEDNFIGHGMGLVTFGDFSIPVNQGVVPIITASGIFGTVNEVVIEVVLGGHGNELLDPESYLVLGYDYVAVIDDTEEIADPIHFVFMGKSVKDVGEQIVGVVDPSELSAVATQFTSVYRAKIDGFEFYTYPE